MKRCKLLIATLAFLFVGFCTSGRAFADPWFGTEGGGTAGGGSGGASATNCSPNNTQLAGCGYSWIFYKATGSWTSDLYFRPLNDGHLTPRISGTCAQHTGENGGFWHLGRNMVANRYNSGWTIKDGYFADMPWLAFYYNTSNTSNLNDSTRTICPWNDWNYCKTLEPYNYGNQAYYTSSGGPGVSTNFGYMGVFNKFGHAATYSYGLLKSAYNLGVSGTNNYKSSLKSGSTTYSVGGHKIYAYNGSGWTLAYTGTKVSSTDGTSGEAWKAYVEAYKAAHNGATPSGWPNDLYAFCYWDGMYTQPVTLTAVSVDTNGNTLGVANVSTQVNKGQSASVTVSSISNYSKVKWCKTKSGSTLGDCTNSTSLTFTQNPLNSNMTVYAVFQLQSRTLTAKAVDENGNSISSQISDVSTTVSHNSSASVTRRTHSGYTFKGWKVASSSTPSVIKAASYVTGTSTSSATYVSGSSSPKETYNVKNLTANATVYAVYAINNYTLTAAAVDTAGKSISSVAANVTNTVTWNSSAAVTRRSPAGWTFKGWKTSATASSYYTTTSTSSAAYVSGSASPKETYNVKNMTADTTVYAVYELQDRTLTATAVNASGASLSTVSGLGNVVSTVKYNSAANVTRGTAAGYTFLGWKTSATATSYVTGTSTSSATYVSGSSSPKETYNVKNLTSNTTVYAVYELNTFTGQASVAQGADWSSTTNRDLTGYVNTSTSKTINVPCANSGCNANFWLQLKRTGGSGATTYRIGRTANGGTTTWDPLLNLSATSITPSTSGSLLLGTSSSVGYLESMNPGESRCWILRFYPTTVANASTVDVSACATAVVSYFQGKTAVTGGTTESTGWVNTTTSKTTNVANCSPTAGCKVTFTHSLKRTSGIGSVDYTVTRTSNLTTGGRAVSAGTIKSTTTFNSNEGNVKSGELTLYPGMKVCETLNFKPNNNTVTVASDVSTTVCVLALGNAQPADPTNPPETMEDSVTSDAFLDMRVKNVNGENAYKKYRKTVYAKPTDTLTYRASYNPVLQYTYYITGLSSQLSDWNNGFSVYGSGHSAVSSYNSAPNYTYAVGSTDKRTATNNIVVPVGAVGSTLRETAETNKINNTKTTPKQITFTNNNGNQKATFNVAAVSSYAEAKVPYNFNITIDSPIVSTGDDDIVFAGENNTIEYPINVNPKTNQETSKNSPYATIVRDAKKRIIIYTPTSNVVDGGSTSWTDDNICSYFGRALDNVNCRYAVNETGDLNADGALAGAKTSIQATLQEDKPAGTIICVAAAVYPASSGADTQMNASGSGTWRISESTCYTVAKKPTFQVWGGNVYSVGNLNALNTVKTINSQKIAFSSWVERDITTIGLVSGIASGAATGLTGNLTGQAGDGNAAGGGSREETTSFCKYRTPLSFANYGGNTLVICDNYDRTGLSGISANSPDTEKMIANLPVNLGSAETNANLTVNSQVTLYAGNTYVARTNGNITINANIIYNNDLYSTIADIPKAFIYANNINIGCNVTRIDAILVANRTVNTCNTAGTDNAPERSNQLVINGAIIANKLVLGRTFGAGVGAYTKIPAEVINYDTSMLLWTKNRSTGGDYNKLTAVYQHELAPRF